jgi:hypothetical protein
MKSSRTKYSDHKMSEYGDLQGREITRLFQAARTNDDLLAMQRGVVFLASRFTPEAVLEVGDSAEAIAWARGAARRMWAEYDGMAADGARRTAERKAEAEGRLIRFPQPRRF